MEVKHSRTQQIEAAPVSYTHLDVYKRQVFEDDDKVFQAICAGAAGYLLKTSSGADITQAVRDALAGGSPMNPRIARRVLEMFSKFAPKQNDYGLSEREKEILQLLSLIHI